MKSSLKSNFYTKIVPLSLFIALWYVVSSFMDPIVLPKPLEILKTTFSIIVSETFFAAAGITILRGVIGIVIASFFGVIVGALVGINKNIATIVEPWILFLQATPIISWLLLALIWFDTTTVPIFVIALSVFPIISINIAEGIKRTDKKLLEMASIYRVKRVDVIRSIYIPSVAGYMISSIRIVVGFAFKIAVMAEVLAHPGTGIGEKMSWARINVETAEIIAWTVVIIFVTWLVDHLLMLLIDKRWSQKK